MRNLKVGAVALIPQGDDFGSLAAIASYVHRYGHETGRVFTTKRLKVAGSLRPTHIAVTRVS